MKHAGTVPKLSVTPSVSGLNRRAGRLLGALVALLLSAGVVVAVAQPSAAADPCTTGNAIACENSKPGSPSSEWEIGDNDGGLIEGFTSDISTNVGGTVQFKIHSSAAYTMDIYRMGYYGGDGARKITTLTTNQTVSAANLPANCADNSTSTGLVDCGSWGVSASWTIPTTAVSGVYFAHITQTASGRDNHVMFVVRNDASRSDIIYQTSDTTWQAYNNWGGNSLYAGQPAGRAYKVSYNRPFNTRGTPGGRDFVWANEYPMIRFLEAQGYDVSYQSGVDTDRYGSLLTNHKTFLSVGHDEYWSGNQRVNVEKARDAGVNLAFFSGNEVYWKTRYEPSIDGSNTGYRTLVTYKETADAARTDPQDLANNTWTGTWRDPRFSPPADGGKPENSLTGTIFTVNSGTRAIQVPAADGKLRFWRNTSLATQAAGAVASLPTGSLGYEWDEDLDNGFRPAGAIKLSTANWDVPEKLQDYGQTVAAGNATHSLVLYRASSGALVFGAGTVQWSWGLDATHDGDTMATSQPMRQATVNLLADMSSQPTTLTSDLTAATKSTDTTAPTSAITSPAAGASIASGSQVTVTGTASDVGGVVGGVEVSMDAGATWHPATGRATWSYTGTADGVGATSIRVRASDDSANVQTSPTVVPVTVACPCRLYGTETPATASDADTGATELGTRFTSSVDGYVTGVTFYKGSKNTGTHTGTLWSAAGAKLATGTFTSETSSGWQTMQFTDPVRIDAGQSYVASYYAPNGGYATTAGYFSGKSSTYSPLTASATTSAAPNGVYRSATGGGFPADTFKGGSYWVSPIFDTVAPPDTIAPSVTGVTPVTGASSIRLSTAPTVGFSEPIKAGSLTLQLSSSAGLVPGTTTFDSARKVATFTPTNPLATSTTYTISTAGGTDDAGNALPAYSSTFKTVTTTVPGSCPCTIWSDSDVPATATVNDSSSVELGLKFTADQDGFVNGVRFYKGPQNVGAHTGTLWSGGGTQLATTTFVNESTTGWQEALFSKPVAVTAGTTYVVSYHTGGFYSASGGLLANAVVNAPLTALASGGASGGNGVYGYGTGNTFPTGSYNSTWYGVDVVFDVPVDTTAPGITSASPGASATNVRTSTVPTITFSEKVVSGPTVTLKAGSSVVASTTTLDSTGRTATVTPASGLQADTTYTVAVSGAKDKAGNVMADYSYTFTTSGLSSCPCSLYPSDYQPAVTSTNDSGAYELGVRFTSSTNGYVTGMRFYKGAGNTGTHVGSLWSSDGALLSSATFTAETASGWQSVAFPAPVAVTAGTSYVASYNAPTGHYAADAAQFAAFWQNGPLTAPAGGTPGNGVYSTTPGRYPTDSYNNTGYGVDVAFATADQVDTVPPSLVRTDPVEGATSVPLSATPTATFNEAIAADSVTGTLTGPDGAVVPSTVAVGASRTVTVTPTAPLANNGKYTVKITGADLAGNALKAPITWSFQTAKASTTACPCSIWPDDSTPQIATDSDSRQVELGVKFSASSDGWIYGLRFYKGAGNTGTHVGTLWSATGTELAKATFGAESAAGWQQVTFAQAVPVTAGTTYVASYHATNGGFSATTAGLATAVTRGPVTALAGTADAPNGVYAYGDRAFPTQGSTANYWVDVLFDTASPPDVTPPTVTGVSSSVVSAAGTSATVTWTTDEVSSSVVQYGTSATSLTSTGTGTSGTAHSVALSGLTADTPYFFRVTSVDAAGNSATSPAAASTAATFTPARNLAQGKTATQSSEAFSGSVSRAVDGNTDGAWASNSVTHTDADAQAWWQVDLGSLSTINTVKVFNRTDCCSDRLNAAVVFISPSDMSGRSYADLQGDSAVKKLNVGAAAPAVATLDAAASAGRYVKIQLPGTNYLSLAEVQVLGGPILDTTPPAVTAVTATASDTGATVTWTTNEASTSVVSYGTAANSLTSTATGTANVTAHSVALTGLTAGTTYYYKVTSADAATNATTAPGTAASFVMPGGASGDLAQGRTVSASSTFETTPWGAAKAVDGVFSSTTNSSGWTSNNTLTANHTEYYQVDLGASKSISQVTLAPRTDSGNLGQGFPVDFTIATSVNGTTWTTATTVTGAAVPSAALNYTFAAVTGRYVRITGTTLRSNPNDGNRYRMQFSEVGVYAPSSSTADLTPPVITAVAASGNTTTGSVTWTTDEASTSTVQYGTSATSLTSTATASGSVTAHTVALTGLVSGTKYYYRVVSTDAAGNTATSPDSSAAAASFTQAAAPPDTTPPTITAVSAASAGATSATVTWTTNEASTSVVAWGTTATSLTTTATGTAGVTAHSVTLTGLPAKTRIYYRVTSADAAGNTTTSPAASSAAAQYAPAGSVTQAGAATFTAGTQATTYVSPRGNGSVTLAPTVTQEFTGTTVPATWASTSVPTGSSVTVANDVATVSGRTFRTTTTYGSTREIDTVATLKPVSGQWIGATSTDFTGTAAWAAFRTTTAGVLVAEVSAGGALGGTTTSANLASTLIGTSHRYEIDWTTTQTIFKVDGTTVATIARGVSTAMYGAVKDTTVDANPVVVDSFWISPYAASGTFTSSVVDAGQSVVWGALTPTATLPSGATINYQVRTGPTATAGGTGWSAWTTVAAGADIAASGQYLQYKAALATTTVRNTTPELTSVQLAYVVS